MQNICNCFLPALKCTYYFCGVRTVLFKDLSAGTVPTLSNLTVQVQYKVVPYLLYPTWRYRSSTICSFYAWHIGMNRLKISESHDTHWLGLIFKEAYQKCWLSMCVRHTVKSYNIAISAEKITAYVYIVVGYFEWYTQCKCHFKRLYAGGLFNSNKVAIFIIYSTVLYIR